MDSRIAVVLLGALSVLSLVGCNDKERTTQAPPTSTEQQAQQPPPTQSSQETQTAPPASAPSAVADDEHAMLNEVQRVTDQFVRYCHDGRTNDSFLFAAIAVPTPAQNPYAQTLSPPGGPAPGSIGAYYQFSLFPSQQRNKLPKLEWHPSHLSDADRRNGLEAQYSINLYAQSYRIYDARTRQWSTWTNAGSFGQNVHFASFTAERRGGEWVVKGGFLINTNGTVKAPASCKEIPGG